MNVPATTARGAIIENVIAKGDLAKLTPEQRNAYYLQVCRSIGLNPLTQPFAYITLNSKLTLYAKRDAADQLRKLNNISIEVVSREVHADIFTVHVRARDNSGRTDEDFGAVFFPETLKGEARANAILKAVTKAKRRVTLSISGLGFADETEIEDVPQHHALPPHDPDTGEITEAMESHERFIAETQRHISEAIDYHALGEWWNSEAEKQKRRDFGLTKPELDSLVELVSARLQQLKPKAA